MKSSASPALVLFFIASCLSIVGVFFKIDSLVLVMKPVIVPSICYYYLQKEEFKVNWLFFLAIFCSFISDMIVLFKLPEGDFSIAIFNILLYLIWIYFLLKDMGVKMVNPKFIFYFVFIVLSFFSITYTVLGLMSSLDDFMINVYMVYGCVLSVLSSIAVFNHFLKLTEKTFYGLIMCFCFIISDVFFAIYNFYLKMEVFVIFNLAAQFISYYYMVKYITFNKVNNEIGNL